MFKNKYLKYKQKYLDLKNEINGDNNLYGGIYIPHSSSSHHYSSSHEKEKKENERIKNEKIKNEKIALYNSSKPNNHKYIELLQKIEYLQKLEHKIFNFINSYKFIDSINNGEFFLICNNQKLESFNNGVEKWIDINPNTVITPFSNCNYNYVIIINSSNIIKIDENAFKNCLLYCFIVHDCKNLLLENIGDCSLMVDNHIFLYFIELPLSYTIEKIKDHNNMINNKLKEKNKSFMDIFTKKKTNDIVNIDNDKMIDDKIRSILGLHEIYMKEKENANDIYQKKIIYVNYYKNQNQIEIKYWPR
jgi:hypothetical protein